MKHMFLLVALLVSTVSAHAGSLKFDKETEVTGGATSKFKASPGWSYDEAEKKLVSPEGDVVAYFKEVKAEKDLTALALKVWKEIDPKFDLPVLRHLSAPAKDGWESAYQVVYETPVKDNSTVLAAIRVFKGTAYVLLLKAADSGLSKRAAQFQIAADSWQPLEFKKEDLSRNKIKTFSEADARELDKFIEHAMKELQIPGASVSIVQNGSQVYRKGFGVKKLGQKDKVTPETLFMIGSTTKPLTTLMLAKLVELGKLKWETPIYQVLPAFELADKDVTRKFQVKHTACACTGMPRRDMEFVFAAKEAGPEDTFKQLHAMQPTTGFGETFQYSNHLVAAGGFAGGAAYGKGTDLFSKYENAMNDLVFGALGMSQSRVRPKADDLSKIASPHGRDLDGKMAAFPQALDDMVYPIAPAGSVWSNVDDLSKYVMMELRKGKSADGRVLYSEEQILKRRSPGVKVDDSQTYGLGLFIENNKGISIIGHAGNTMGFTHDLFFLPDHDVGMIIQSNAGGVNGFRNSLKQKLLEIMLKANPKSEETLQFSKNVYKQMADTAHEHITFKPKENQWVGAYAGSYTNKYLGRVKLMKEKNSFRLVTNRWTCDLATQKEKSGEKLLAFASAPWSGNGALRVSEDGGRKLILDDDQLSYEFVEEK